MYLCFVIKNKKMKTEELYFNIDVPAFLNEIQANASPKQAYVMRTPMQVLKQKLAEIAKIAIEIDNPKLNVLMLETKLYEVDHYDIQNLIQAQKKRMDQPTTNKS